MADRTTHEHSRASAQREARTDRPGDGPARSEAVVRDPLADLRRRLREFRSRETTDPRAAADQLADMERGLLALAFREAERSDQKRVGGATLADLHEWSELCLRLGLDDCVDSVDELAHGLLHNGAEAWKQRIEVLWSETREGEAPAEPARRADSANGGSAGASPSRDESGEQRAQTLFDSLLQTTVLQLEADNHCPRRTAGQDVCATVRQSLRQTLADRLSQESPSSETLNQWATRLMDRADMVLTGIDDLPPERAAAQLEVMAGDLDWHLRHVDTGRGESRRRLKRKLAQLRAERQERELRSRLNARFGDRLVSFTEATVLWLIFLVVVLMIVGWTASLSETTQLWFTVIDTAACCLFLTEFGVKLALVSGRGRWFLRHALIDFIPSLPVGLISGAGIADVVRFGRLPRLLRVLRGFGLLARGLDRLVRQYGNILNQNVILYPTRDELERLGGPRSDRQSQRRKLRAELRDCWRDVLTGADPTVRSRIARTRLGVWQETLAPTMAAGAAGLDLHMPPAREIPAATLIERLRTITEDDVETELGEGLTSQLARIVRVLARPPMRWLPLIRGWVPAITAEMTDAAVVAGASARLARLLKWYHDAWFWVADLYGTVTPSQFVDRVGTMLVNSSSRPAYRLVLFGGALGLTQLSLWLLNVSALQPVQTFLQRYVGVTVIVLGSVCVIILVIGMWLRRMAQEATEFYERSAKAQYLALTEAVRTRYLERDEEVLYERVLRPEWLLTGSEAAQDRSRHLRYFSDRVRQSLLEAHVGGGERPPFEGLENIVLLYRDWLDGAMFTDNDTRATSQLLGNPAVRQFLNLSGRVDKKQIKTLQLLDLERQKSLLGGPYLWFNFISRSISHSVACLLVDYNQHAIPLSELPRIRPEDHDRYRQWLARDEVAATEAGGNEQKTEQAEARYVTTAFTALHFLDCDPERDREVEERFGAEVLRKLQTDRSRLIRRIFGTYPLHDRPKEQRVVNLFSVYKNWLSGGRALFLPWFVFLALLKLLGRVLAWIKDSVEEIRHPERRESTQDAAKADFLTAVRKIERVRGPVVEASLRLRMFLDPEFLAVPLPGNERSTLEGTDVDTDLNFLQPDPTLAEEVEYERQRAEADMRRLDRLIQSDLLQRAAERRELPPDTFQTPEHVRAAAIAYSADISEVRRHLSPRAILDEVYRSAATRPLYPKTAMPHPLLWRKFARYWNQHGFGETRERQKAWRATVHNVQGVADALCVWDRLGEAAPEEGERILGEMLLHPGRLTEQLLMLRAIQTLAVLDVLNYRDHVYRLGRYAESGEDAGDLLEWNTGGTETESAA